jgi:hypothetical protein
VILGAQRFHLPACASLVHPPNEPNEAESEISGVSRRAMEVELCLPHTTFLNVDDEAVDVEAEMKKKARSVLEKRKKAAEKLAETRVSSKRAMVAAKKLRVGNARGHGSADSSKGGEVGATANDAQVSARQVDDHEESDVDGEVEEEANENDSEDEDKGEEEDAGNPPPWNAFEIRGIGTHAEEKVYVVWNMVSPDDSGVCEVTWSPISAMANLSALYPNSTKTSLNRDDLKFNKELIGRSITGTFKYQDEEGHTTLADEDGVVKEYDEKTALHIVQWDGGTNVDPKEVGTGDLIKHQLMLTAKMMQTFDEDSEKWMKSREVLVKWYLDEDEAAYAYPPMK